MWYRPIPRVSLPRSRSWITPEVDVSGLVNITRYHGSKYHARTGATEGSPDYAILRTFIDAQDDRLIRMNFGYSDAATIFLNQAPLFWGNSAFLSRNKADGEWISFNDAVFLNLKKGRNELLVVVAEDFGGWGFQARVGQRRWNRGPLELRWVERLAAEPSGSAVEPGRVRCCCERGGALPGSCCERPGTGPQQPAGMPPGPGAEVAARELRGRDGGSQSSRRERQRAAAAERARSNRRRRQTRRVTVAGPRPRADGRPGHASHPRSRRPLPGAPPGRRAADAHQPDRSAASLRGDRDAPSGRMHGLHGLRRCGTLVMDAEIAGARSAAASERGRPFHAVSHSENDLRSTGWN